MKKTLILTAVATLLASVTLPAIAQDAAAGAGAGVKVDTPAVDVQAGGNANAAANSNAGGVSDNTFGSVMSSLKSSADVDLSAVTDANISVVLLSSLQGNAATETAALDKALTDNADAMTKLHANLAANAAIKAKLEAEGHSADDVVAVKTNADGSLIVYVDDRA
ncbi:MAG TPA: hypothetical protein VLZ53_01630 [Devosia sp.]|nr:hypothetical protein [Devosia sp.]